jgi:hypothetical protein
LDGFGGHGGNRRGKDWEAYRSAQKPANEPLPCGISGSRHLSLQHEQLDRARRNWLIDLTRQYERQPSAGNALRLASGEWKCGEYEAALRHFVIARDLSPEVPEPHLALVHAASMMGLRPVEDAALELALQQHPQAPRLRLHAARRQIPSDWVAARALLQSTLQDPACALFDLAIGAVSGGSKPPLDRHSDPRERAKLKGLHWVLDHSTDPDVHAGLSTDVLSRALMAAPEAGLTLECGVYFGRSLRLIAGETRSQVHGFDSFQGLPEAWNDSEGPGSYSTAGRLPAVADNVVLHPGWFEHTLPPFFAANATPIRLLHIDCDIYSSTRTVLATAVDHLVPGSIVVFDDFLGYPGFEQHELRAFEEWVQAHRIDWELIAANLLGREVAIRITEN